jgi:plastocyanin
MPTHFIDVSSRGYDPARLLVYQDDTVIWRNTDAAGHSATADNGEFDTGIIPFGQLAGKIIIQPVGTTLPYHDSQSKFQGEIVVTVPKDDRKSAA